MQDKIPEEIKKRIEEEYPLSYEGQIGAAMHNEFAYAKRSAARFGYLLLQSAAPQPKGKLQWVKAEDRNPRKEGEYFVHAKDGASRYMGTRAFKQGLWYANNHDEKVIEWIEETTEAISALPSSSPTEVKGVEEAKDDLINKMDKAFDYWSKFDGEKQQGIAYGINLIREWVIAGAGWQQYSQSDAVGFAEWILNSRFQRDKDICFRDYDGQGSHQFSPKDLYQLYLKSKSVN